MRRDCLSDKKRPARIRAETMRTIFAAVTLVASFAVVPVPAIAQSSTDICNTGPYRFEGIVAGLNNNQSRLRSELSSLGYLARSNGCAIAVQCATRAVTDPSERQDANREASQICSATVQMLTRIGFTPPRGNSLTAQANTDRRNAIQFSRVPESSGFPVGAVLIELSQGVN